MTYRVVLGIIIAVCIGLSLCLIGLLGFSAGRITQVCPAESPLPSPETPLGESVWMIEKAHVTAVIDGDTIEIEGGEKIRYIGIDTPETDECYGPEATEANRELVEGKEVILIRDIENRDKYERLLRYVIADGRFVNAELVRLGYAEPRSYGESVMFQQVLTLFGRYAREEKVGLWSQCQ